jgi:hypothetical protein
MTPCGQFWHTGPWVVPEQYNGLLFIHKNEVLIHDTTLMKLKTLCLAKEQYVTKNAYCMILFVQNIQYKQSHRDRKLIGVFQG